MEFQLTKSGNSYWDRTGYFQPEYTKLYKELVPPSGYAATLNGEILRAISRLTYEYCNNGNCNAKEIIEDEVENECSYCFGSGEILDEEECDDCGGCGFYYETEVTDVQIDYFYERFLEMLENFIPDSEEEIKKIREIICTTYFSPGNEFSEENMLAYTHLTDKVIYFILNNENKELPSEWQN